MKGHISHASSKIDIKQYQRSQGDLSDILEKIRESILENKPITF